jgi:hypothetical protein
VIPDVVHPRIVDLDRSVLDQLDETASVILVRVGADYSPQTCSVSLQEKILHDVGITACAAIYQNSLRADFAPLGNKNTVGVSKRDHVNFCATEHQTPPQRWVVRSLSSSFGGEGRGYVMQ